MPPDIFPEDFRTLGLEPGCDQSEIKQAYRRLAKKWHPDRFHSQSYEMRALAEEKFRQINEAYKRISTSDRKDSPEPRAKAEPAPRSAPQPRKSPGEKVARGKPLKRFHASQFAAAFLFALIATAAVSQLPTFMPLFTTEDAGKPAEPSQAAKPPESPEPRETVPDEKLLSDAPPAPHLLPPEDKEVPDRFFTLGSTVSEVLLVQGAPSRVHGQTWVYGLSEIQFKNGHVWKFNNFDGMLRVRMPASAPDPARAPQSITIGSTENDVLLVHGTPTCVEADKWYYGFAEVRFREGRVKEYDNYFGNLKVQVLPSRVPGSKAPKKFFTIGSSPDEVLEVQGTPTSIRGNSWSYSFSTIFFRDGKVQHVSNSDGTLRFAPPPEPR